MKILTDKQFAELLEKAEGSVPVKKLNKQVAELTKSLKLAEEDYKEAKQTTAREHRKEVVELRRELEDAISKRDRKVALLQVENDELQSLVKSDTDLKKRAIKLEADEQMFKAKNDMFDSVSEELVKAKAVSEEKRDEGYKSGYADGIADGLREASKITAEDRKMAMQIAALAASSHQPDAAQEVAKNVLKELSSGSGK